MAGRIDAISQMLGRLEAGEEERQRQTAELFNKLDEMKKDIAELKPLIKTVNEIKPEVEDWTRTKNRAMGAIAFLSCIAAVMGAVGSWFAEHLGKFLR